MDFINFVFIFSCIVFIPSLYTLFGYQYIGDISMSQNVLLKLHGSTIIYLTNDLLWECWMFLIIMQIQRINSLNYNCCVINF